MSAPVGRVLDRLERVHRKTDGSGWTARCPAHPDRRPSLTVAEGHDGRALLTCWAGCDVAAIVAGLGLELRDLFPRDEAPPVARRAVTRPAQAFSEDDAARFAAALRGNASALDRLEGLRGWTRQVVDKLGLGLDGERIVFPVRDAGGALVGLLRYAPNGERRNGSPKMLAAAGSRRELFPAPERFASDARLWLVEGEPDAVRALSLGVPAAGVPGVQAWRHEWAERFRGRRVVVCFDADAAGRKAAADAAGDLAGVAADVRVLDLDPSASEDDGYDLSDFARLASTSSERAEARQILERSADRAPIHARRRQA